MGGVNTFGYVLQNPSSNLDFMGLDVWIEGPSGGEPSFHQSVNVGDPSGSYSSYSFGMNGNGIYGEVYRDNDLGGKIELYKKTTSTQDDEYKKRLDSKVGETGIYVYDDICRSWSQREYNLIPGKSINPPRRNKKPQLKASPLPLRVVTGVSSLTGTGTSK